jgi:tripartite ATP-independent transporter DctP family solute receptor
MLGNSPRGAVVLGSLLVFFSLVFSSLVFSSLMCGAARAQNYTLVVGHVLDPESSINVGMKKFKEVAEAQSKGRLKVNVFPGATLGDSREMQLQTQSGAIFGLVDATTKMVNFVPEFGLLDIPFLVTNEQAAYKLLDSPEFDKIFNAKAEKAGFRWLYSVDVSFRHIYTSRKPTTSIADLKGQKIRVIPSPSYINLFKAFGSSPTPMNFGELYTALEQGVVDGAENDLITYYTSKHYEPAKKLAMTSHMMLVQGLNVSEKLWKSYPPDIRKVIEAAAVESRKAVMLERDRLMQTTMAELKKKGVEITQPPLKPFEDAARSTYGAFEERYGKAQVDNIRSLAARAAH